MKRTFLSKEDLLGWMNSQLAEHEECNDCIFTSVTELSEEDQDGCNWSSPNLRCSGVPSQVCNPTADLIVGQARARVNVKWE